MPGETGIRDTGPSLESSRQTISPMIVHLRSFFLLFVLSLFLGSCQISGPDDPESGVTQIRSGISFGFCIGYCITELVVESRSSRLTRRAWDKGRQGPPDQLLEKELSRETWQKLTALVDFEILDGMSEVYGCPDCADGGSEWIEVTSGDRTKKVLFEFNAVLEPISALVDTLRSIRESFVDELESD